MEVQFYRIISSVYEMVHDIQAMQQIKNCFNRLDKKKNIIRNLSHVYPLFLFFVYLLRS